MIEATQKKLRETHFFLSQLEQELNSPGLNPTEAVEFYFSAFLSAARSVTFVLEAEGKTKYPAWSQDWRNTRSEGERSLLSRFTTARNRALKRETPNVAEERFGFATDNEFPISIRMFLWEEDQSPMGSRVLKCRLTPDDTEEEAIPLCREYAALLSDLVHSFIKAYS